MSATVLLTGASGYLGGGIATALRTAEMTVISAGRRVTDSLFMDLTDPEAISVLKIPAGVSVVVHAGAAHELVCRQSPVAAFTANVTASRALVAAAFAARVRRLVYISTFHVFGKPAGVLDERACPNPANDYGLTHFLAEQVFANAAKTYGIESHILRPGNIFGSPASWASFNRWTLAPFDFVQQAIQTGRIVLMSDGLQVRNYVSLARLGEAAVAAAKGELPDITHIAGMPWSIRGLAELVAHVVERETGRRIRVIYGAKTTAKAQYDYESLHWPHSVACEKAEMSAFIASTVRRVRDLINE